MSDTEVFLPSEAILQLNGIEDTVDLPMVALKKPIHPRSHKLLDNLLRDGQLTAFTEDLKVHDVCRGFIICENGSKFAYRPNTIKDNNITSNFPDLAPLSKIGDSGAIIFIIESPHKDEYDYHCADGTCYHLPITSDLHFQRMTPRAPAQGVTGMQINEEHLFMLFRDIIPRHSDVFPKDKTVEIPLIICNPVPYQASLWAFFRACYSREIRDHIRDSCWLAIWQKEKSGMTLCQEDLKARLNNYIPCIIIDACTGNRKRNDKNFNKLVYDALEEWGYRDITYRTSHPSSWANEKACRIK